MGLERCNPRFKHSGHIFTELKEDSLSDSECEDIVPEFLDPVTDRAFIDYLNKFDGPDSFDDLNDWSDDIDLFMEGLSNPDKIEELWEKSKAKKTRDDPQYNTTTYKQDFFTNTTSPDDSIRLDNYMGWWCNTAHQRVQFPDSPTSLYEPGSKPESYSKSEENLDKEISNGAGETPKRICTLDSDSTKKTEICQNSTKDGNINRKTSEHIQDARRRTRSLDPQKL